MYVRIYLYAYLSYISLSSVQARYIRKVYIAVVDEIKNIYPNILQTLSTGNTALAPARPCFDLQTPMLQCHAMFDTLHFWYDIKICVLHLRRRFFEILHAFSL